MKSFEEIFAVEPEFLRVTTKGDYRFNELFDFLVRVRAKAGTAGRNRVLIDSRQLKGKMTEAERFTGGQQIAQIFGGKLKAALVMPSDNITKLGELAAVNRGARFLVTDSETEATRWLTGQLN